MRKMTHKALEIGIAYNKGMSKMIKIRETKNYYISEYGTKYRKNDGSIVGERFAIFKLDISTIKAL